jgi:hypothetical protein
MNMVVFIQAYKNSPFTLCCDQELIVFGFPSLIDNQTTLNVFFSNCQEYLYRNFKSNYPLSHKTNTFKCALFPSQFIQSY